MRKTEGISYTEYHKKVHKQYENLTEVILGKRIQKPFATLLLKTRITPDQVTVSGLVSSIIAGFFFVLGDYIFLLGGCLFLYIAYICDGVDGQIARFRNQTSHLGKWLDRSTDRIKETTAFLGLMIGVYNKTHNVSILFFGMISAINFLYFHYLTVLTETHIGRRATPLVRLKKRFFGAQVVVAISSLTIYIIIFFALLNKVYYFLVLYATVGAFIWMLKYYKDYKVVRKLDLKS